MEGADGYLVLISALEHWSYCPRQCGLIHLEQTFSDNVYTVRGHHAHQRVHAEADHNAGDVRIVRAMSLWSGDLGVVGKADVVEFHGETPYPIEYKVGKRHRWGHEDIQLGAQAMCLEEMLSLPVPRGAIFYRESKRRREVVIDGDLRALVRATTRAVRAMLSEEHLPPATAARGCTLLSERVRIETRPWVLIRTTY